MPRIILIKENGQRISIECNSVPTHGGGPGTLEIPNVEIRTHHPKDGSMDYQYLWFPPGPNDPEQPDDLVIKLCAPLEQDSMILPFNGGHIPAQPPDDATEVTVKLRT
jgi:hypothetical protein